MLHELLLALNGYHGQIFYLQQSLDVPSRGQPEAQFKVNTALPLFHPAELNIIRSLLSVASEYYAIECFIQRHRDTNARRILNADREEDDPLHGLYVEALCEGFSTVLKPYRDTLVGLEHFILNEGNAQLTYIQHKLSPHEPVLTAINTLIRHLYLRKAHGCFILDMVYKASCSGVALVQEAMKKILHIGHKVLYKQLLAWILQGNLFDPYDEFFIGIDESRTTLGERTVSLSHISTLSEQHMTQKPRIRYKLRADLVPGHISLKLAEKIFFIGDSIQLFEADRKLEEQGSVLKERETEFYQKLVRLRDEPEFHIPSFERFVDSVSESASEHLLTLVLERSDLREELSMVRNFFLLGRGELFQVFIQRADSFLQRPVTATTQHDVNMCFQASCRSIFSDDEAVSKKVRVFIQDPSEEDENEDKPKAKPIGWNLLILQYSVQWPLHLILTESCLEDYNRIFQFLVTVKRAQLSLHKVWATTMINKQQRYMELRTHMMFVIDNLQQYFMADVLESQCSILAKSMDNAKNFEELKRSHENFLSSVTALTFVNNKPVHQCLSELLDLCLHFCKIIMMPSGLDQGAAIGEIALMFGRQSELLFSLLTSLKNHHTGSHLAQLLLRIDFNRYFSKNGHSVGKIA